MDAICSKHSSPTDHLLDVISAFLKNNATPTWRTIINALKTPAVNLPYLARRLKSSHFPKPASAPAFVSEASWSTGNTYIKIFTVINNYSYHADFPTVAHIPTSTPAQPSQETSNSGIYTIIVRTVTIQLFVYAVSKC